MTISDPGWNWGPAWNKVRNDINVLAWLFEEERVIQRLYVESLFWVLTGKSFPVYDFAKELGVGAAAEGTVNEPERSAESALDGSSQSQV